MSRARGIQVFLRQIKSGGKVTEKWYGRTSYKGSDGRRHEIRRSGDTKTEARKRVEAALEDLKVKGDETARNEKKTFRELAVWFEDNYLVEAEYIGDMKVKGVRSKGWRSLLKTLRKFFDSMPLRDINYNTVSLYKDKRIAAPVYTNKEKTEQRKRSIASVNRELTLLRRMFNVAITKKWMYENPFHAGEPLISHAAELPRQRILTPEEEERIFNTCLNSPKCKHLKPILMMLMDTGMRRNELLRLKWKDIDFDERLVTAVSYKGKVKQERIIGLTKRLHAELKTLWDNSVQDTELSVFGIKTDIKKGWTTVREKAGLSDVRLHDLRHHAATQMIRAGITHSLVSRALGHSDPKTTYRYISPDAEDMRDIAKALDNQRREVKKDDE